MACDNLLSENIVTSHDYACMVVWRWLLLYYLSDGSMAYRQWLGMCYPLGYHLTDVTKAR